MSQLFTDSKLFVQHLEVWVVKFKDTRSTKDEKRTTQMRIKMFLVSKSNNQPEHYCPSSQVSYPEAE